MNPLWSVVSVLFIVNNALSFPQNSRDGGMTVVHKWKYLEFDYPNAKAKSEAIKKGEYIAANNMPLDSDYHLPTDRYFLAMPPFRNGTPASLGEVARGQTNIKPFPKWPNFNDKNICQKGPPFSVYRIFIDKCGLLWVPDTGINESLYATKINCPPKLLVYDLNFNKDQEILRYEFPTGVVTDRSLIVNVFTESYRSDCSDSIAYIADIMDYAMIVFDFAKKTSWRISHKYFRMFPTSPTMTMTNGVALDLNDGLCGMALSPVTDKERKLYFHSFSSLHECWVPVSVLKNSTAVQDALVLRNSFHISPGMRVGHSTVQVMTDDGILIYPVVPNNTLSCWNYRTPFTRENQHVMKRDDENFQFISGLKLIGNKLLVTSSRFHNYLLLNLSTTDYNFRLTMIEDVRQLLRNTPCASFVGPNIPSDNSNGGGIGVREPSYSGNGNQNIGSSCRGSSCEKPQTSTPSVREPSYSGNSNSNGGAPCYGSVCERPQSSSSSAREPTGNGYPPKPPNSISGGVIFKQHANKKSTSYDQVHNRLGGSDANSTEESEDLVSQDTMKIDSTKKVPTGTSASYARARALKGYSR